MGSPEICEEPSRKSARKSARSQANRFAFEYQETCEEPGKPSECKEPCAYPECSEPSCLGLLVGYLLVQLPFAILSILVHLIWLPVLLLYLCLPRPSPPRQTFPNPPPVQARRKAPPLPTSLAGATVGFSGCINNWYFCLGAALCLQTAGKQRPDVWQSLKFLGLSSGAPLAGLLAANIDLSDGKVLHELIEGLLEEMNTSPLFGIWPSSQNLRVVAGAFPRILKALITCDAFRQAVGKVGLVVTVFDPCAKPVLIWPRSVLEFLHVAKASSFVPLVPFKLSPVVSLPWYGVAIDGSVGCGGSLFNVYKCDVIVSPNTPDNPHVGPRQCGLNEDPPVMRSSMHPLDAHFLLEKGFEACCVWLESM